MQSRLRLLIIVAFIVILLGVVAAFVLPGLGGDSDTPTTSPNTSGQQGVVQQPTAGPTSTPQPTAAPLIDIVVAVQPLARGAIIPPNAVAIRQWPEASVPIEAIGSLEDVIGRRARSDIYVEQPILTSMVIENLSQLSSTGSDLAASIPVGQRAVAVPIDRLTSVAYGIQTGDRVDIIVSLLFVEIDEDFQSILPNNITVNILSPDGTLTTIPGVDGRVEESFIDTSGNVVSRIASPREEPRPRLLTQMTIQDALVMGVGDFPPDGVLYALQLQPSPTPAQVTGAQQQQQAAAGTPLPATQAPPRPDIVTLSVSPQDAVLLTYLIESRIPITFALRSAADNSQVPTSAVTLSYIINNYNITLPQRLDFSTQPAIRSIRQLIASQQISLDTP